MHPDAVTRIGVHRILAVILVPTSYHRYDCTFFQSEYFERRRWQSKTSSAFASATALLEKLRREECIKTERHVNNALDEFKDREIVDEDGKHGWVRKSSPNFCKINCSIIDRAAAATSSSDAVSISLPFSMRKPLEQIPNPLVWLWNLWFRWMCSENIWLKYSGIVTGYLIFYIYDGHRNRKPYLVTAGNSTLPFMVSAILLHPYSDITL